MTINHKKLDRTINFLLEETVDGVLANVAAVGEVTTADGRRAQVLITVTADEDDFMRAGKEFRCIK